MKLDSGFDKGVLSASSTVFATSSSNIVTILGVGHKYTFDATSQVADLVEQFKKFLVTQSYAISPSAFSLNGFASSNLSAMSSSIWILDFGVSHHISYDPKYFVSLNPGMIVDGTPMPLAVTPSSVTHRIKFSLHSSMLDLYW